MLLLPYKHADFSALWQVQVQTRSTSKCWRRCWAKFCCTSQQNILIQQLDGSEWRGKCFEKKSLIMAMGGEILVYFPVCENRDEALQTVKKVMFLSHIQVFSFTLSRCLITLKYFCKDLLNFVLFICFMFFYLFFKHSFKQSAPEPF